MDKSNDRQPGSQVPPDMLAMLGMTIVPLIAALLTGMLLDPLFQAWSGDPTMLYLAVVLAGIGIVLLFFARLPLYRQRRFFSIGSGALDPKHRRLYRWAYGFIGSGTILLALLHLVLR